jgi:dipeptidase D
LEPKAVWGYFDQITKIPRCSKHEEKIREYIMRVGEEKGLGSKSDGVGNVVIRVPPTPGKEDAPTVVLQSHMDMVCEKDSSIKHDFSKDPISVKVEEEWVTAEGTTLGADDGMGVAAALAMTEGMVHGPLELLFTVDEETGITGASCLEPNFISGKTLINLDSEEFGSICIGCAGGGQSDIMLNLNYEPAKGKPIKIRVGGLRGGHSGVDINAGRANAIKLLARVLWDLSERAEIRICDIRGGDKHNAIPREASVVITIPKERAGEVEKSIELVNTFKQEYGGEKMLEITAEEANAEKMLTRESTYSVIGLLQALPNGVLAMCQEVPDLVETSTNLAVVKMEENLKAVMSTRSSINSALQATRDTIKAISRGFGAEVEEGEAYPGWKPNPDSELLKVAKRAYEELFGESPEIGAIHAGLETGIICERFGEVDSISIGPTVEHPHSPDERVSITSVQKFWGHLNRMLEELAG